MGRVVVTGLKGKKGENGAPLRSAAARRSLASALAFAKVRPAEDWFRSAARPACVCCVEWLSLSQGDCPGGAANGEYGGKVGSFEARPPERGRGEGLPFCLVLKMPAMLDSA